MPGRNMRRSGSGSETTLGQAIDELGWRNAGQEAIKRYKLMETFAGNISDVLALFADV